MGTLRLKFETAFLILLLLLLPMTATSDDGKAPASKIEIASDYFQELVVRKAHEFLGTPYRYGGVTRSGVDCSGLVYAVYAATIDKKLSRSVADLYRTLPAADGVLPGDLVFFDTTGGVSHVGIYIGGGKIIHAASQGPQTGVIISSLSEDYYKKRYLGTRRVFQHTPPALFVTLGSTRIQTQLFAPFSKGKPFHVEVTDQSGINENLHCRMVKTGVDDPCRTLVVSPGEQKAFDWSVSESGAYTIIFSCKNYGDIIRIELTVE